MAGEGLPTERLRAFLRELKPEAQSLLVTEVERGALRGADIPGASLILAELRPALRQAPHPPARVGNPQRLFFRPLEPFLIERAARARAGRIERASLEMLWGWIGTGLLPTQTKAYSDTVAGGLSGGDAAGVEAAVAAFQDEAARAMRAALDRARADERFERRLATQIRTERALEEVETLTVVLAHRQALAAIAARLPGHFRSFTDDQADNTVALLRKNLAGRDAAVRHALILVAARLDTFHALLRVAIRAAESDAAAKVAQGPLALAVDMVLAEIRGAGEELRGLCRRGRFAEALAPLKEIHDAVRAVRTQLDLPADSGWARELAAIRATISEFLRVEIEATGGWVRRLLRQRAGRDTSPELDPDEVAEVESRIALVAACRGYAGELAVNQVAPRAYTELQTYLEGGIPGLIESLRQARGAERRLRQSQVDAAVRFIGRLFGSEYAALLTRAAAMAAAEPKPAPARP